MSGLSFSSKFSVNAYDENPLLTLFEPDSVPYEDNITDKEVVYEREVEDNTDDNEHATGLFWYYQQDDAEYNTKELVD